MTLFEGVTCERRQQDFRRSSSLKGMPAQQMPSQMHQVWLCRDCWDTVCYNWHSLPRASAKNLTLAKHNFTLQCCPIWVIPSGEAGGQRRKYWSVMLCTAPKDTLLQKRLHPHRQTKPTKTSLQTAAEHPIKSSSISNLPHHGKLQATPSNRGSLRVLLYMLSPHAHPNLPQENFRWKIC